MGDRRRSLTGALAVAAVLAAGCTALPSGGGAPASAPAGPGLGVEAGGCCGLIVRGPQPDWDAVQIVYGFLLASAKPADNFALAREYLEPGTRWKPGSVVTILASTPEVSPLRIGPPGGTTVRVSGQELATLQGGQYTPAASGDQAARPQQFITAQVHGQTLITQLPSIGGLLLTDQLFHLVYTARDLYYDGLGTSTLVPSPVFIPADANQALTLASDLLHDPPGALGNALTTEFPPGARITSVESAPGKTAVVSLSLPAGTASTNYMQMARQLVATLTSSGYGPQLFQAVELKINGTVWAPPHGDSVLTPATAGLGAPHAVGAGSVYYVDSGGGIRALGRLAPSGVPVSGDTGPGRVQAGDVAVSPDGKYLAAIEQHQNAVYTATLQGGSQPDGHPLAGPLHRQLGNGTDLTSLSWDDSWDNHHDLWVAGQVGRRQGVWVLPGGRGSPVKVTGLAGLGGVTAIQVAPDGIRVAMLVGGGPTGPHIELGYIMRTGPQDFSVTHVLPLGPGLVHVSAIAWYDEDHLVAAAQQGTGTPQLWEVPANGDGATSLHSPQPDVTSITAAGPRPPLYLTEKGHLLTSVGLGQPWTLVTQGQAADYPG